MSTVDNIGSPDRSERGGALIAVLLLTMVLSALTTALVVSGRTEVLASRNHELAAQAQGAGEAGINHALELTITNVRAWAANGYASSSAAMTGLLRGPDNLVGMPTTNADNGSLELLGIPRPPATISTAVALGNIAYEARVYDEDDPARGVTLTAADLARIGEDGVATNDANGRLIVQAIGYAPEGTRARFEAIISPAVLPAIVTNGDLTISGNPSILGSAGSVHANDDLTISGNPTIAKNATSSDTYEVSGSPNVGGQAGGGRPTFPIPPVRAIDHKPKADFILKSNGQMTNQAGGVICDAGADNGACRDLGYGWEYQGANGWKISANNVPIGGSYYVEGKAEVSGNPGTPANPLPLTIIAEGDIKISGNPDLTTDSPELMFVTDGDLEISGGLTQPLQIEGQVLVRGQLKISGNPELRGQFIVEDVLNAGTLIDSNTITGNPTITFNGTLSSATFEISAWREVR